MSFKRHSRTLLLTILLTAGAVAGVENPLGLQERGQEQLRGETARIGGLLEGLMAEFDRNGLGGTDVATIHAIRSVLGQLAEEQMPAIVESIARGRAEAIPARQQHLLRAYADQKSAAIQLRQLLLEHQLQMDLHHLAARVQELGDRQSRNLHQAVALVGARAKPRAGRRTDEFQLARQLQETEERALKEEVEAIAKRLAALAGGGSEALIETRPGDAVALVEREELVKNLAAAEAELAGDRLMSAVSFQRRARNTLWRLARVLAPSRDRLEQLLAMRAQLEHLLAAQNVVIKETQALRPVDEAMQQWNEKEAEDDDRDHRMHPEDLLERAVENVQARQAVIVDRADFVREELQALAPFAGALLGAAIEPMQQVRAALGTATPVPQRKTVALPLEEAALAKLKEAHQALLAALEEEQLAAALAAEQMQQAALAEFAALQARRNKIFDAIAEALQLIAQALSQLNPQVSALQSLQQRQQAIADQLAQSNPAAQSAAAQAQQSATQAANQLGQASLPAAVQSMQQALDQLGQAQQAAAGREAPSFASLAQEQTEVKRLAEQLLAPGAIPAGMPLNRALGLIAPLNAGALGWLPAPAASALQAAQAALAQAAAQAAANSAPPAQSSALAAQGFLAQASAALALYQAGLGMAPGQSPGMGLAPGTAPGMGIAPGQGQGMGLAPGQGQGQPSPRGPGNLGNWTGAGGADGPRRSRTGASGFIGLPQRERGSVRQSQAERYPQEFRSEIDQYFQKLSEAATEE